MTSQQLQKLKRLAQEILEENGPSAKISISVESILTVLDRMEAAESMLEDLEEGNMDDFNDGDTH